MLPYTTVLPKPLLPVGDKPILSVLIDQLAGCGFTRVELCVGYLGELIRAYLAEAPPVPGVELAFHGETEPLGTAGPLREIGDLDEAFLTLNGDVLTTLDYGAMLGEHVASGAALTIAVQPRESAIPFGVVELDGERVTAYLEKPVTTHLVNLGIYAWDPRALAYLTGSARLDIPEVVAALLEAGEAVRAHVFRGPWFDIGTPEQHQAAIADLEANPDRYRPRALSPGWATRARAASERWGQGQERHKARGGAQS